MLLKSRPLRPEGHPGKKSLLAPLLAPLLALGIAGCSNPQATAPTETEFRPKVTAAPTIAVTRVPTPPIASSLVGVAPNVLTSKIGQPQFKRTEPNAEIWRYRAEGCMLLVFFYKEGAGLRSAHLDARREGGGATDINACLASVSNAHYNVRG